MSDPLCGPSNALQSFQKHSSVDRTLQQDRLVSRQSPSQAFRSQDATAGTLDQEFEAFQAGQAGQAPAFAGPSFSTNHPFPLQQSHLQQSPPHAEWTQAFHQLSLSQPLQEQQHMREPWNIQSQHAHNGLAHFVPPGSHVPSATARFQPPAFGHGTFQPRNPYMLQAQQPQQHLQARQELPQETFDEAAFEAAFDAAMADANNDQDTFMRSPQEQEQEHQNSYKPDIHPHLPLFRLVLAQALVTNTDESLHKAAKVIHLLDSHQDIEPTQTILLRPLLTALTDPNRTLLAQRYLLGERMARMIDRFEHDEERAEIRIDQTTEQLLAAYADILWQRDNSNHLRPSEQPRSVEDRRWLEKLWDESADKSQNDTAWTGNITNRSLNLLTRDFHGQLGFHPGSSSSQPLNSALELELDAFSRKLNHMGSTKSLDPSANQVTLFNLVESAMSAPETIEAIEAHYGPIGSLGDSEQAEADSRENHEPVDFAMQILLLEQQNKKRLLLAKMEMQQLRENANRETQMADNLEGREMDVSDQTQAERGMEAVGQAQDQQDMLRHPRPPEMHQMAEEWESTAHDTSYDQLEEQPPQQQPHDEQHDNELAQTAADLLDRVADNKTSKFQNSAFLGLMRQLADREVRVEGGKMVPTTASADVNGQHNTTFNTLFSDARQPPTANSQPSNIPRDGQEVVDLLNQPGDIVSDQDPEFMMTSPFANPNDY